MDPSSPGHHIRALDEDLRRNFRTDGQRPVGEPHRVPGVLPALVLKSPPRFVDVFQKSVAVAVAVFDQTRLLSSAAAGRRCAVVRCPAGSSSPRWPGVVAGRHWGAVVDRCNAPNECASRLAMGSAATARRLIRLDSGREARSEAARSLWWALLGLAATVLPAFLGPGLLLSVACSVN